MKHSFKGRYHLILIVGVILISSCARQIISFNKSMIVPAATGNIKIKEDKNSNYSIDLKVNNLASADRLHPSRDHYVLWMESDRHPTQNLGRLISSKRLFGKAFKAKLNAVTTYTPTKFFITAEDDVELISPQGEVILTTDELRMTSSR